MAWMTSASALSGLIFVAAATNALPDALWLTSPEISKAFEGKTLQGRYANGKAFVERYGRDGRVDYREAEGFVTAGHWSVTAGTFCTIYDGDASGGCFRVSRSGKNCFEFYFITRTEESAKSHKDERPKWTARGSVSGEAASCDEASV